MSTRANIAFHFITPVSGDDKHHDHLNFMRPMDGNAGEVVPLLIAALDVAIARDKRREGCHPILQDVMTQLLTGDAYNRLMVHAGGTDYGTSAEWNYTLNATAGDDIQIFIDHRNSRDNWVGQFVGTPTKLKEWAIRKGYIDDPILAESFLDDQSISFDGVDSIPEVNGGFFAFKLSDATTGAKCLLSYDMETRDISANLGEWEYAASTEQLLAIEKAVPFSVYEMLKTYKMH